MEALDGTPAYEEIMLKLDKVERGNLGDARSVGGGVVELEVDFGPGYRIYVGLIGKNADIVVLLHCAAKGSKKKQQEDIETAQRYWKECCNEPED